MIVEGHGETAAVPVLLRRFIEAGDVWDVELGRPIRRQRSELVQQAGLERAIELALLEKCDAILILLDSDDDCPAELAPRLHQWATAAAVDIPCEVVLPHREYEAWFLASIESLRGIRGIKDDAESHPTPERPRGTKEHLQARMQPETSYSETKDQPALTAQFSMPDAYAKCRSFRKLAKAFGDLLHAAGRHIDQWPPSDWIEDH